MEHTVFKEYPECLACSLKYCEPKCFDNHIGSRIALGKCLNEVKDKFDIDVYIGGEP